MLSFYFFPSDLHSFGDELNSSSKTAPANIGAHKNWSKHLGISNCVFTMICSADKKIVFWSFLGRDFICWGATKTFWKVDMTWWENLLFHQFLVRCRSVGISASNVLCWKIHADISKLDHSNSNSAFQLCQTPNRRHFLQETHISSFIEARPKGTISREIIELIFGWFYRAIEGV